MTDTGFSEEDFYLYRPDIFECLKEGTTLSDGTFASAPEFFSAAMAIACGQIARGYGCTIRQSAQRVEECQKYWVEDLGRTRIDGDTTPDHYKQAGLLSFWLRRRIVVEPFAKLPNAEPDANQDFFSDFGSELCAFLIGFRICAYFEAHEAISKFENVSAIFRDVELPENFLIDVCKLMRFKNVSPHSLYLIYRALFLSIDMKKTPKAKLRSVK